jgi:hypothetical protein
VGLFRNPKTGDTKLASKDLSYSIPSDVSDLVLMVAGLSPSFLTRLQLSSSTRTAAGTATATVTPNTIYTNYGSPKDGASGAKKGSQAVVEFGQLANFNEADSQTFFSLYQPSLLGEACGMAYGTNNGAVRASVEANLDVQYIMAAGAFINTTDYKIAGGGGIEDEFLSYTMLVNSQIDPPLVHSISYGEYGGSYDNTTDQRFSYELQKVFPYLISTS